MAVDGRKDLAKLQNFGISVTEMAKKYKKGARRGYDRC